MDMAAVWTIGRAPDCDLRVHDPFASDKHCQIGQSGTRFYVRDIGSLNGTRIRTAVTTMPVYGFWVPLMYGDTLIVGRSELPWTAPGG